MFHTRKNVLIVYLTKITILQCEQIVTEYMGSDYAINFDFRLCFTREIRADGSVIRELPILYSYLNFFTRICIYIFRYRI